jgi:hypothetical protein
MDFTSAYIQLCQGILPKNRSSCQWTNAAIICLHKNGSKIGQLTVEKYSMEKKLFESSSKQNSLLMDSICHEVEMKHWDYTV